jgi:predicted metallo-beta-lactamase superfamily hydrolase
MDEKDKLRVLIPHWIEHNEEHAAEFRQWAEQAGEASADILTAAENMAQVNEALERALAKLGGALPYQHPV